MNRWLLLATGVIAVVLAAAGAAMALMPAPETGHRPFHIGCKDHNHGPKWHASHGKSALVPVSRFTRPDSLDDEPTEQKR